MLLTAWMTVLRPCLNHYIDFELRLHLKNLVELLDLIVTTSVKIKMDLRVDKLMRNSDQMLPLIVVSSINATLERLKKIYM